MHSAFLIPPGIGRDGTKWFGGGALRCILARSAFRRMFSLVFSVYSLAWILQLPVAAFLDHLFYNCSSLFDYDPVISFVYLLLCMGL